jgi:hypothetical protein
MIFMNGFGFSSKDWSMILEAENDAILLQPFDGVQGRRSDTIACMKSDHPQQEETASRRKISTDLSHIQYNGLSVIYSLRYLRA